MKKQGMSCTKRSGDRMVRLISLREQGELYHWAKPKPRKPEDKFAPRFRLRPDSDEPSEDKYRTWPQADLPTLSSPHSDCPRAQILNTMIPSTPKRCWAPPWDSTNKKSTGTSFHSNIASR
jgi:hypothetical protein